MLVLVSFIEDANPLLQSLSHLVQPFISLLYTISNMPKVFNRTIFCDTYETYFDTNYLISSFV
jgi:hypothetical protein